MNLIGANTFSPVRRLEGSDPLLGGAAVVGGATNSPYNFALKALVNRTEHLRQLSQNIQADIDIATESDAGIIRKHTRAEALAGNSNAGSMSALRTHQAIDDFFPSPTWQSWTPTLSNASGLRVLGRALLYRGSQGAISGAGYFPYSTTLGVLDAHYLALNDLILFNVSISASFITISPGSLINEAGTAPTDSQHPPQLRNLRYSRTAYFDMSTHAVPFSEVQGHVLVEKTGGSFPLTNGWVEANGNNLRVNIQSVRHDPADYPLTDDRTSQVQGNFRVARGVVHISGYYLVSS